MAHACQEVEALDLADWDIPLFGVVTDKELILATKRIEKEGLKKD